VDNPPGLKYTKDHVWAKPEGSIAVIGITHFGQESMGEITYVDLPLLGKDLEKDQIIFAIGSSKAFIDLPSPVSGKVLEVNEVINTDPTIINNDPYDKGWMVKMSLANPAELDSLMDKTAYDTFLQT